MTEIVPKGIRARPAHALPSGRHLADFSAFYVSAQLLKDGTCKLTLQLPPDEKHHTLALSDNDGMLLNFTAHETRLADGMEELAVFLGLAEE